LRRQDFWLIALSFPSILEVSMNKLLGTTLVSVCLAATTVSIATAQTTPRADAPSASAHAQHHAERPFSRPTERVEARLAYVKTALKITEAQQSQWDAFANLVRKNAQDREQRFKAMHPGESMHAGHQRPNAIERLEKAQTFHAEAVTRINQLLAVEKPLYAALSPEQQKVADVVLNRRSGSMHGPQMHGRGGPGRN
jgi:periplasmic protein CpxP/Spy